MFNDLRRALGKVFGSQSEVQEVFKYLVKDDRALPGDVADFVAKGEPTSVLVRLASVQGAAKKIGVIGHEVWSLEGGEHDAHRKLLAAMGAWHPAEVLRLAQVYFAATQAPTANQGFTLQRNGHFPAGYEWVETLMRQLTASSPNVWSSKPKPTPAVTLSTIEAAIAANQQDPLQLARCALIVDPTTYTWLALTPIIRSFSDFKDLIERHPAVAREAFAHADYRVKVHALETIAFAKANPVLWREEIASFLVVSSKQVRQAAEPLVRTVPEEFRTLLEKHATEGDNETRAQAIQSLDRIYREACHDFLRARAAEEKGKKALAALEDILRVAGASDHTQSTGAAATDDWNLPVLTPPAKDAPLAPGVRDDLRRCLEQAHAEAAAAFERIKHQKWAGKFKPDPVEELIDPLFEQLQHGLKVAGGRRDLNWREWQDGAKRILAFAGHPDFQLIHLVRWCRLWIGDEKHRFWLTWAEPAMNAYIKTHGAPPLRELALAFEAAGLDPKTIGRSYLQLINAAFLASRSTIFRQPAEGIWPYFAERPELLETALGAMVTAEEKDYMSRYYEREERHNALLALSTFPRTPRRLVPILWDIALKGAKAERLDAQAALAREPDTIARLIASLANGQMEVRAEAAAWLGRLKAMEAREPLLAALKKEKKESPQSAMMTALERLGVPIDQLVDRAALEKEAIKQAAKPVPAGLEWFQFTTLPPLHWADDGRLVPAELVRWLILQAFKVKNPEPGPLLRTYAGFFAAVDRAKVGRFVAEAWIAQDTIPAHTAEEAAKLAEASTQQMAQHYAQYPQFAAGWDQQQHYRAMYNSYLTQCKGSATDAKGILAVASALGTGELAPIVHRYVKYYYGLRASQCKALLSMLAWIDDPNAIQVLLAIGNRFRTKSIQEEASRLCQELADRKNWTLDELADRTIPTAGLDDDGVLELDFGPRAFAARLTADFTLTLTNAAGKEIASLPEPNQSDDAEKAKVAKQALSSARKELKTVLKMQEERLYEAMCTQRQWTWGDLRRFLFAHPIVGRLCTQLVWCTVAEGKTVSTFRPLPDHTLTNTDDDTVELPDTATIRLAHEVTVSAAERAAWLSHLTDYKVEPLFAQFGKTPFALDEKIRDETEIKDFVGHVVENFKLRGRLTKLGYTRGQAQDGGWFMDYNKRFPGLGIQATIHFSGSPLPEENRPVALLHLAFGRIGPQGETDTNDGGLRLGSLPPVLVSECWNDLRLAAADGRGFDPNWQKTSQI